MKLWHIVPAAALLVSGAGCSGVGGGDSSADRPASVNTAAAKESAKSAIAAALAAREGEGADSVASFAELGSGALMLLMPEGAGQQTQALPRLAAAAAARDAGESGVDCSDAACSFDGYSPDGSFTLDGTISWGDDHLVADLTVSMAREGMSFDFETTADLVVTGTSIDGRVTSSGTVVVPRAQQYGSPGEVAWEAALEYHDLTFADGQPTGGSMEVSASLSSGDQSYSGEVTVSFP